MVNSSKLAQRVKSWPEPGPGSWSTIESEDQLLRTFENPFKFKCNICEFTAKSDRGLKSHKTRQHENCDWCEFICAEESEMKKHKMDKHTIAYSKEVLQGLIAKSPW